MQTKTSMFNGLTRRTTWRKKKWKRRNESEFSCVHNNTSSDLWQRNGNRSKGREMTTKRKEFPICLSLWFALLVHFTQVCQIGVMIDFDIVTLTQYGDFDFKTITVFLYSKFDQHPFFLAIEIKWYVRALVCQETDNLSKEIPFYIKKYLMMWN